MSDRSGKTEQPTQQRLKKARKEGNFPQAKEFVSALQFVVFLMLLGAGGASAAAPETMLVVGDSLATGFYVASPLLCAGAVLLGLSGIPNHSPVSPAELPSVGDTR